jgi:hypothetical protein
MAVQKEWNCLAHGAFDGPSMDDGANPPCPHGCGNSMVERAFRTAPSIQSAGYRQINATMTSLAAEHGLTDMANRSTSQDGIGMRRATPETYKRLNEATALIMQSSRSGQVGVDASQYFKPLSGFQPGSTGEGGALHREGSQVMVGGLALNSPKPILEAAPFDGRNAGLPAGDAS